MYNYDPSTKKAKLAIRFFTYGVMTVSTIVVSVLMIFFALGYRFDTNFNFSQGGLVQFKAYPDGAKITIDKKLQSFTTPNKKSLATGTHNIGLSLAGYKTWNKSVDLAAGQLLWINYVRLIPESIKTTNLHQFDALASSVVSPDKHWILVQPVATDPKLALVDLTDEKNPKFTDLALPESSFERRDGQAGTFSIVEWDLKSQYILIKHQVADVTEFLRLDRSKPAETINLTKVFALPVAQAHFSGNSAAIVYVNTSGVLRKLDISSKSASGALVENVNNFIVYGDGTVAFDAMQDQTLGDPSTKKRVVGVWRETKISVVRRFNTDVVPVFDYGEYNNHNYMVIGNQSSAEIEIVRDPLATITNDGADTSLIKFGLGVNLKWLKFSANGRMVAAQNGNTFASYDLEENKAYQQNIDYGAEMTSPLRWLDNYYLWSNANSKLHFVEFDGTNSRDIVGAKLSSQAFIGSSGEKAFSFADVDGKVQLRSSSLTVVK